MTDPKHARTEQTDPEPTNVEDIKADVERTRAELAQTVEQLSDKLNPATQAHKAADSAKQTIAEKSAHAKASAPEPVQHALDRAGETAGPAVRRANDAMRPHRAKIALGVVALGAVLIVVRRRRDR